MADIHMIGIDQETYESMLSVAKKEQKSVSDVASEALKKHLDSKKITEGIPQKKMLMESN